MKFIKKHSSFLYPVIVFGASYVVDWIGNNTDGFVRWISWITILMFSFFTVKVIYSWGEEERYKTDD